jgi:hypothetical protein
MRKRRWNDEINTSFPIQSRSFRCELIMNDGNIPIVGHHSTDLAYFQPRVVYFFIDQVIYHYIMTYALSHKETTRACFCSKLRGLPPADPRYQSSLPVRFRVITMKCCWRGRSFCAGVSGLRVVERCLRIIFWRLRVIPWDLEIIFLPRGIIPRGLRMTGSVVFPTGIRPRPTVRPGRARAPWPGRLHAPSTTRTTLRRL